MPATEIPYDLSKFKRTQELVVGDVVHSPGGCWFEDGEPVTITEIAFGGLEYVVTFTDGEFYDRVAAGLDTGWEMA